MESWVIYVALATWLTARGWLRSRLFGRAGRSSRRFNRYSQPTAARSILPELDPDRTLHQATCRWCDAREYVPLRVCRLEARPWRLTWQCASCNRRTRVRVAPEVLPMLLQQDRAFGMAISRREVEDFADAGLVELEQAILDELL